MFINEVNIRNITTEDVNGIINLIYSLNKEDKLEIPITEEKFYRLFSNSKTAENFFVAYCNDILIAFGGCFIQSTLGEKNAHFELYVHPNYRLKGLGSMIYKIVTDNARKLGVKKLLTRVKKRMDGSVDFLKKRDFNQYEFWWKMDLTLDNGNIEKLDLGELTYREITKKDKKQYIEILNHVLEEEKKDKLTEDFFDRIVGQPNKHIYLVEKQGVLIATATVTIEDNISRGYISNVVVYKQFRGQGIGEKVLRLCINKIKERGMKKASLHVVGVNESALRLYEKIGFVKVDTDIRMEKIL